MASRPTPISWNRRSRWASAHTFFGRAERADKNELFLEGDPREGETFRVGKLTAGYVHDFVTRRPPQDRCRRARQQVFVARRAAFRTTAAARRRSCCLPASRSNEPMKYAVIAVVLSAACGEAPPRQSRSPIRKMPPRWRSAPRCTRALRRVPRRAGSRGNRIGAGSCRMGGCRRRRTTRRATPGTTRTRCFSASRSTA